MMNRQTILNRPVYNPLRMERFSKKIVWAFACIFFLLIGFFPGMKVEADEQPSALPGATIPVLEPVSSLGGEVSAVEIAGTYSFIGEGSELTVIDVSTPSTPVRSASRELPGVAIEHKPVFTSDHPVTNLLYYIYIYLFIEQCKVWCKKGVS